MFSSCQGIQVHNRYWVNNTIKCVDRGNRNKEKERVVERKVQRERKRIKASNAFCLDKCGLWFPQDHNYHPLIQQLGGGYGTIIFPFQRVHSFSSNRPASCNKYSICIEKKTGRRRKASCELEGERTCYFKPSRRSHSKIFQSYRWRKIDKSGFYTMRFLVPMREIMFIGHATFLSSSHADYLWSFMSLVIHKSGFFQNK